MEKGEAAARARRRAVAGIGTVTEYQYLDKLDKFFIGGGRNGDFHEEEANALALAAGIPVIGYKIGNATKDEETALAVYTGNDYDPMNAALRGTAEPTPDISKKINDLRTLIAKNTLERATLLYRYVYTDVGNELLALKSGDVFIEKGFSSTSLSRKWARGVGSGRVMLEIRAPAGTHGVYPRDTPEYEVILQAGTAYRVVGSRKMAGSTYIQVEIVGGENG